MKGLKGMKGQSGHGGVGVWHLNGWRLSMLERSDWRRLS